VIYSEANDHWRKKIEEVADCRRNRFPFADAGGDWGELWVDYRPPELLLGAHLNGRPGEQPFENVNGHAADIWCLGCWFAEMVMKEPVFAGEMPTDVDVMMKVRRALVLLVLVVLVALVLVLLVLVLVLLLLLLLVLLVVMVVLVVLLVLQMVVVLVAPLMVLLVLLALLLVLLVLT